VKQKWFIITACLLCIIFLFVITECSLLNAFAVDAASGTRGNDAEWEIIDENGNIDIFSLILGLVMIALFVAIVVSLIVAIVLLWRPIVCVADIMWTVCVGIITSVAKRVIKVIKFIFQR